MDWWRDNAGVLGLLTGGLAGAIVTQIVNFVTRERKLIAYSSVNRPVLKRASSVTNMQVSGVPVSSIGLCEFEMRNMGNRTIEKFGAKILSPGGSACDLSVDSVPDGCELHASLVAEGTEIEINVDFLNPGDSIRISFVLVNGGVSMPKVVCRLPGVEIQRSEFALNSHEAISLFAETMPFPMGAYFRLVKRVLGHGSAR